MDREEEPVWLRKEKRMKARHGHSLDGLGLANGSNGKGKMEKLKNVRTRVGGTGK